MPDTLARPATACVCCLPPGPSRAWRQADPGYRTCSNCYDRLRELIKDVVRRYWLLNPAPGNSGEHGGRGAPGFGSRAPASDHVIAMRDRRSSAVARVWVARDGRVHQEAERPPLSVHNVLDTIAWDIAEQRDVTHPGDRADVAQLARWIDGHMDWLTRQDAVADVDRQLRELVAQLKPVTGEPGRRHIGTCPNTIDEGETTRSCRARLYAPLRGDTITCVSCGRPWHRPDWEKLGKMLQEETLQRAS